MTTPPRRQLLVVALVAATLLLPLPAGAASTCADPADPAYDTYDCKVERLRARSFVVVAVVDTGINPYHVDFRVDPDDDLATVPPWEFIDGYPAGTEALELTLDADTYGEARSRDAAVWSQARFNRLYHLPGTKIVGGYAVSGSALVGSVPVLDENGHGTAVASVAAGAVHGASSDDDVLIVAVSGIGTDPFRWAANQPWIDVVTNSWAFLGNVGTGSVSRDSRAASLQGKLVLFAAGNGLSGTTLACDRSLTWTSAAAGPSWITSVGAVSPHNGQAYCWHSVPPDVSSFGRFWPAAAHDSIDGDRQFSGTSNATPIVAGVMAEQVLTARRLFADPRQGPRPDRSLARLQDGAPPGSGPLADGALTATEVRDAVLKTAEPVPFDPSTLPDDPWVTPTTPGYYVIQGYGVVDADSKARAHAVLVGDEPLPDRSDVDTWMEAKHAVADLFWLTLFP